MTEVERTASGAGMMRALEGHARDPLFTDPLAQQFLSGWQATVCAHGLLRRIFVTLMDLAGPGFYGAVVCRTRAIDDECRTLLAAGVEQVVILGAGMDTRPYRLPAFRSLPVWELDLPTSQRAKRDAVARALPAPPANIHYVPIDLATQRVTDVLDVPAVPTLVICEAVSMYLPPEAVDEIIAYAGGRPPGSRLILTYLPRAVADDPRHARWSRRLHWQTALTPADLAARLTAHGLHPLADLGAEDHQERLLRPAGRTLKVFPGERIAIAERYQQA